MEFTMCGAADRPVFVFSSLNERSRLLAECIAANNKNAVLVFFRTKKNAEPEFALGNSLSFFYEDDVSSAGKELILESGKLSVYIIDDSESVCVSDAAAFISRCGEFFVSSRKNAAELFVIASSHKAATALDGMDKSGLIFRRINDDAVFAQRLLYDNPVFDYADENGVINISLLGFGGFCEEMMKAIIWNSQRDGYSLSLSIFSDGINEAGFRERYPELLDTESLSDADEINYRVNLYGASDFEKSDGMKEAALVFIEADNDSDALDTAARAGRKFSEAGAGPLIKAVVKNAAEESELSRRYNISFISKKAIYSENRLTDGVLEGLALGLFNLRNEKLDEKSRADFYSRDFNYRASIASALLWSVRHKQGQSLEPSEKNMMLEHKRWNAFMRTEGYRYGKPRSDVKKLHPCLVAWDMLTKEMQSYDANPIIAAYKYFNNK